MMESHPQKTARLVLSRLSVPNLAPWQPAWSSLLLQETIAQLLEPPDGRIEDLLGGLWSHFGAAEVVLTQLVAAFVRDVVKLTFGPHRTRYEAADFSWLVAGVNEGCSAAQAYFALHALQPKLTFECRTALLETLASTPFAALARHMLVIEPGGE